jgi:ketosteroid isomerase-like protein
MDKTTVYDFVNAINEHDVDRILSLMTDDHIFVDAHGNEVVGKARMKAGWIGYFQWFPDYKIELWQVYADTKIPFDIISKNK